MAINNNRFLVKNGLDNNSKTITNVADPVNASDAATRAYVLANAGGSQTLDTVVTNGNTTALMIKSTNTTTQSLTDGALWLSGGGGAILLDDSAHKRISWNDGGGNFNLRAGHYQSATGTVYAKGAADANGGAGVISIATDVVDGSLFLGTSVIGVPGAAVTWGNSLSIHSTLGSYFTGNVLIGTSTQLAPASNRRYLTIMGSGDQGSLQLANSVAGSGNNGNIEWYDVGNTSSSSLRNAYISSGTTGSTANNKGAVISFGTKADGVSGGGAERMSINATGQVTIGVNAATAPDASALLVSTGYISSQAQSTTARSAVQAVAHDFYNASWANINMSYMGKTTAGTMTYNPSMNNANACAIEAINSAGISIHTNTGPISIATSSVERIRIGDGTSIQMKHPGNATYGSVLQLETTGGTDDPALTFKNYNGGTPSYAGIAVTDAGGISFRTGAYTGAWGTERALIDTNGIYTPHNVRASGFSTGWGTTNGQTTGAFNTTMGTAASATWLLSGTSGGTFRCGIQALDSNGIIRIFSNGTNYVELNGNNLVAAGSLTTGDITAYRSAAATTGYIYFGNTGTKYCGFDGSNFVTSMPMYFNILGSSASCTGNAATATLATKASTLSQSGGNGTAMTFNWSGQGGQPSWLWGSNDGSNIYVYNPSNFSVSYATTSGTSSSCSGNSATSTVATYQGMNFGTTGNWNTYFTETTAARRSWTESSVGGPTGTWWFIENMRHSNAGGYWGRQNAWGWEDNATELYSRNVQNGTWGSWVRFLHSSNFSSYALPLTGGTMSGSIQMAPAGTTRGYFYADGAGIGMLNSVGGWANRVDYGTSNFYCMGDITAAGNVTAYSDPRLKENFQVIQNPLDIVNAIDGGTFTWKEGIEHTKGKAGKKDYGILADQVQAVMPEIVMTSTEIEGESYRTVAYDKLIPVLLEAIKELEARIKVLESK